MIRHQNPDYQETMLKLEALRNSAKEILLEIDRKFGPVGGQRQVMDGGEEVKTSNGNILIQDYESDEFRTIEDDELSLQRIGMVLDNTACNLGLWRNH